MNSVSSRPSRAGVGPDSSDLLYCRRLPYFSCNAFTAGVNTNDPKFGIMFLRGRGTGRAAPARDSHELTPPCVVVSLRSFRSDWRSLLRAFPAQNDPYPVDESRCL